ncbi:MAG: ribosome biogenesis GTPase Der [Armatimonadetes bacterium]|nr:ribosome biogenesis GTPase Der [Armatimonadota bacterium]
MRGLPVVAIVGRVNVGKSSLFNRLVGQRLAVVGDEPGVTRDRVYAQADFDGRSVLLVDTGGLAGSQGDELFTKVAGQAVAALKEADVVIFVVDAQEGITLLDHDVADVVRKSGKPVVFVANKAERSGVDLAQFTELGFGQPIAASAIHALGASEIVEAVRELLPAVEETQQPEGEGVAVAVVGRPNAGKSSLVNALVGEERMIVSETPGTTRDAVDTVLMRGGRRFVLVDTAGLRRKFKKAQGVEYYAALRALKAVERADVAVLVIDAVEGPTSQDERLAAQAEELGRGLVIAAHKWDLVLVSAAGESHEKAKKHKDRLIWQDYERLLRETLPAATHAPVCFTSAVTGHGLEELLDTVWAVGEGVHRRVSTYLLNRTVQDLMDEQSPPSRGGRSLKLLYATQVSVRPPTVVLFVNDPALATDSYMRYVQKALRDRLYGPGVPVRLLLRPREKGRAIGRRARSGRR